MSRTVLAITLLAIGAGWLSPGAASASGSVGPGAGKVSPKAAYSQGKALTFDLLACASCPLSRDELDRERARSLTASLVAVHGGKQTGSSDDESVAKICGGRSVADGDCKLKMELVHYFLTRRFKL